MANDKVYIHEFIDIRGHNRAKYMHHMTANWSPNGQEDRHQLCYGVWSLLGSTGLWPQVVNMWEEQGWDGLAASFAGEAVGVGAQDPKLVKWWAAAAAFRRGGTDRIMLAAPWARTIEELCADGVRGEVYAHELIKLRPGSSSDFLDRVRETGAAHLRPYGWELFGGFTTAMVNDDEALLLWAIPTWQQWAEGEKAHVADGDLVRWRSDMRDQVTSWQRVLLIDSPLSPMKIGRQPARSDRTDWEEL